MLKYWNRLIIDTTFTLSFSIQKLRDFKLNGMTWTCHMSAYIHEWSLILVW